MFRVHVYRMKATKKLRCAKLIIFEMAEIVEVTQTLESVLMALQISDPAETNLGLLTELDRALGFSVLQRGLADVSRFCDELLRRELKATSLTSFLVSFITLNPEAFGEVCEQCLHHITPSTVACGASRGKIEAVRISDDFDLQIELGDFYDEWTGCRVWPGASHIARMLIEKRFDLERANVLELGSGVGVTGISALLANANSVTFTEYKQALLDVALSNASRNQPKDLLSSVDGFILDWTDFDLNSHDGFRSFRAHHPADFVVIGSELIYEDCHAEHVIAVLDQLFRSGASRGLIVVMVKPMRDGVNLFIDKLSNLPLSSSFSARVVLEDDDKYQTAACIFLDARTDNNNSF